MATATATATATAATQSNRSNPKEEGSSDNAADVRAAALAVLRLADKRTSGGGTAAKHRSPVPTLSPTTRPAPSKRASAPPAAGSSSSSSSSSSFNGGTTGGGGSFSFMRSFRNQVNEARESMNRLDEKFLALQFEQEEKIRKAFDRTSSQWSGAISSSSSSSPRNDDDQSAQQQQQRQQRPPEAQSAILSRFRSSFQGFTQSARRQLNLPPQQQQRGNGNGAEQPPRRQRHASMDEAIVAELERLHEKMTLCHSLLAARDEERSKTEKGGGYEPDPRLPKTIKFLESCLGRMDQLMEAGIDGQFQEDTTQICVSTYERLILTLEKCNSPLVKSNAFAFTKDLEGDSEFDEVAPPPAPGRPGRAATADDAAAESGRPAAANADAGTGPDAEPDLAPDGWDAGSDLDLDDADLDIDLAAFEIGSDHDEEDIVLNVTDDEQAEEEVGETTPADNNESSASDDDFIKDMFE